MGNVRFPALEVPQPLAHRADLPQMRLLDELGLGGEVANAVAVPVVDGAGDQVLRVEVGGVAGRGVVGVVADVEPDVDVAVDEGEAVRGEIEAAVVVVVVEVRRAGDGVVFAFWKSPFAPLLGVVDLEHAGDQGWAGCGCDLVGALFGAGAVQVAAIRGVGGVGVEGLVLGAEAGCTVDRDTVTEWEEGLFHVLGVVTEVGPSFAITVFTEHGVDRCDVFGGIQIGDIRAEDEEILGAICRVPVELLPCVGRIVHWPADWESNCHCEVSVVCQRLKAENCLEFFYCFSVVCSN